MRLSERGSKATATESTSAWGMIVWSLGEPVVLFCEKNIAMGELEISVEGSCRLGVRGGSFIMFHGTSLANWRSIQREGFRTTVGFLGEGVYLTRDLEKAKAYMPGGAAKQVCGK